MSELIKAAEKWVKTDYVLCVNALEEAEDLIPELLEQLQQANKDKAALIEALEDAITNLPYMPFEDIPEVQEEYRAIAAKHKEAEDE